MSEELEIPPMPQWLEEAADGIEEGVVRLHGYDDCIIGLAESFGAKSHLVYDLTKMLAKLVAEGMEEEEAFEWYSFNIVGGYFGENGPVFVHTAPPQGTEE
jgi:hypothetical protein